jgi:cytochrome c2
MIGRRAPAGLIALLGLVALLVLAGSGCGSSSAHVDVPGGDASHAQALVDAYGCGACHQIAGIDGADGRVGPSLVDFADRRYIAGRLPNNLDNLLRWIESPQEVAPGSVMPDLGVEEPQARDLAAYLYSH